MAKPFDALKTRPASPSPFSGGAPGAGMRFTSAPKPVAPAKGFGQGQNVFGGKAAGGVPDRRDVADAGEIKRWITLPNGQVIPIKTPSGSQHLLRTKGSSFFFDPKDNHPYKLDARSPSGIKSAFEDVEAMPDGAGRLVKKVAGQTLDVGEDAAFVAKQAAATAKGLAAEEKKAADAAKKAESEAKKAEAAGLRTAKAEALVTIGSAKEILAENERQLHLQTTSSAKRAQAIAEDLRSDGYRLDFVDKALEEASDPQIVEDLKKEREGLTALMEGKRKQQETFELDAQRAALREEEYLRGQIGLESELNRKKLAVATMTNTGRLPSVESTTGINAPLATTAPAPTAKPEVPLGQAALDAGEDVSAVVRSLYSQQADTVEAYRHWRDSVKIDGVMIDRANSPDGAFWDGKRWLDVVPGMRLDTAKEVRAVVLPKVEGMSLAGDEVKVGESRIGEVWRDEAGVPSLLMARNAPGVRSSPSLRSGNPYDGVPEYAEVSPQFIDGLQREGAFAQTGEAIPSEMTRKAQEQWAAQRWDDGQVNGLLTEWRSGNDRDRAEIVKRLQPEAAFAEPNNPQSWRLDTRKLYLGGQISLQQARLLEREFYGVQPGIKPLTQAWQEFKSGESETAKRLAGIASNVLSSPHQIVGALEQASSAFLVDYYKANGHRADFDLAEYNQLRESLAAGEAGRTWWTAQVDNALQNAVGSSAGILVGMGKFFGTLPQALGGPQVGMTPEEWALVRDGTLYTGAAMRRNLSDRGLFTPSTWWEGKEGQAVTRSIDTLFAKIDNETLTETDFDDLAKEIARSSIQQSQRLGTPDEMQTTPEGWDIAREGLLNYYDPSSPQSPLAGLLMAYQATRDPAIRAQFEQMVRSSPDEMEFHERTAAYASAQGTISENDFAGPLRLGFRGGQVAPMQEIIVEILGTYASVGIGKALATGVRMAKRVQEAGKAMNVVQRAALGLSRMGERWVQMGLREGRPMQNLLVQGAKQAVTSGIAEGAEEFVGAWGQTGATLGDAFVQSLQGAIGGLGLAPIMGGAGVAVDAFQQMRTQRAEMKGYADFAAQWTKDHPDDPIDAAGVKQMAGYMPPVFRAENAAAMKAAAEQMEQALVAAQQAAKDGPPSPEVMAPIEEAHAAALDTLKGHAAELRLRTVAAKEAMQEINGIADPTHRAFADAALKARMGQKLAPREVSALLNSVDETGKALAEETEGGWRFTEAGLNALAESAPMTRESFFPAEENEVTPSPERMEANGAPVSTNGKDQTTNGAPVSTNGTASISGQGQAEVSGVPVPVPTPDGAVGDESSPAAPTPAPSPATTAPAPAPTEEGTMHYVPVKITLPGGAVKTMDLEQMATSPEEAAQRVAQSPVMQAYQRRGATVEVGNTAPAASPAATETRTETSPQSPAPQPAANARNLPQSAAKGVETNTETALPETDLGREEPGAAIAAALASKQATQKAEVRPWRKVLEGVATAFGHKLVDTGLPFGFVDQWGKFHSFGTQLLDKMNPGSEIGQWIDKVGNAAPELAAKIGQSMTQPFFHRVWFGHDPAANVATIVDRFGWGALPEYAGQLAKDFMTKAGVPLPGTQWLVHSGIVGDETATKWLSLNVGEAFSGGLALLGSWKLMKKARNGQEIHAGWAMAGIAFKLAGGAMQANPILILSGLTDSAILVAAKPAAVKAAFEVMAKTGDQGETQEAGQAAAAAPVEEPATAVAATPPPLPKDNSQMGFFKTSKGSSYILHANGTTTRDKAARPEHPGEQGPQPRSSKTIFVTKEGADALGLVQTEGVQFVIEQMKDGRWAAKAVSGPYAGKFYETSITNASELPAKGLIPVEIWNFNGAHQAVHFGNEITEVSLPQKSLVAPLDESLIPAGLPGQALNEAIAARLYPAMQALEPRLRMMAWDSALRLNATLALYAETFPGGIRFSEKRAANLWVDQGGTLNINLPHYLRDTAQTTTREAIMAMVEEELAHIAAMRVMTDTEVVNLWKSLPAAMQRQVYKAYHVADIANKRVPSEPKGDWGSSAWNYGHEFVRMLVTDREFQGRVAEAVEVDPGFGAKIVAWLKTFIARLRQGIEALPPAQRSAVKEYEYRVRQALREMLKLPPLQKPTAEQTKTTGKRIETLRAWVRSQPKETSVWAALTDKGDVVSIPGEAATTPWDARKQLASQARVRGQWLAWDAGLAGLNVPWADVNEELESWQSRSAQQLALLADPTIVESLKGVDDTLQMLPMPTEEDFSDVGPPEIEEAQLQRATIPKQMELGLDPIARRRDLRGKRDLLVMRVEGMGDLVARKVWDTPEQEAKLRKDLARYEALLAKVEGKMLADYGPGEVRREVDKTGDIKSVKPGQGSKPSPEKAGVAAGPKVDTAAAVGGRGEVRSEKSPAAEGKVPSPADAKAAAIAYQEEVLADAQATEAAKEKARKVLAKLRGEAMAEPVAVEVAAVSNDTGESAPESVNPTPELAAPAEKAPVSPPPAVPATIGQENINARPSVAWADVSTPGTMSNPNGTLRAAATQSQAPSGVWYYQGDLQQLAFNERATVNGQSSSTPYGKQVLAEAQAAKAAGWTYTNVKSSRMGTVWVFRKGDQVLTRAGAAALASGKMERPDVQPSEAGYQSMIDRFGAYSAKLVEWLQTLKPSTLDSSSALSNKIGNGLISKWVRLVPNPYSTGERFTLQFLKEDGGAELALYGDTVDRIIEEVVRYAAAWRDRTGEGLDPLFRAISYEEQQANVWRKPSEAMAALGFPAAGEETPVTPPPSATPTTRLQDLNAPELLSPAEWLAAGRSEEEHRKLIREAMGLGKRRPVNAATVAAYEMTPPALYVRKGEQLVYGPLEAKMEAQKRRQGKSKKGETSPPAEFGSGGVAAAPVQASVPVMTRDATKPEQMTVEELAAETKRIAVEDATEALEAVKSGRESPNVFTNGFRNKAEMIRARKAALLKAQEMEPVADIWGTAITATQTGNPIWAGLIESLDDTDKQLSPGPAGEPGGTVESIRKQLIQSLSDKGYKQVGDFFVMSDKAAPEPAPVKPTTAAAETPAKAEAKVEEHLQDVKATEGTRPAAEIKAELLAWLNQTLGTLGQEPEFRWNEPKTKNGRREITVVEGAVNLFTVEETSDGWTVYKGITATPKAEIGRVGAVAINRAKPLVESIIARYQMPAGTPNLEVRIPGDGTFTISRTHSAVREMIRRVEDLSVKEDRNSKPKSLLGKSPTGELKNWALEWGTVDSAVEAQRDYQWLEQLFGSWAEDSKADDPGSQTLPDSLVRDIKGGRTYNAKLFGAAAAWANSQGMEGGLKRSFTAGFRMPTWNKLRAWMKKRAGQASTMAGVEWTPEAETVPVAPTEAAPVHAPAPVVETPAPAPETAPVAGPVDKKTPISKKAVETAAAITDFGEVLDGARKHLWGTVATALKMELPAEGADIVMSKHWPEPDYAKLLKAGVNPDVLTTFKALRDAIPPKPRQGYKLRQWADMVRTLHKYMREMIDGESYITPERLNELTEGAGSRLRTKILFYRMLHHLDANGPSNGLLFTEAKDWGIGNGVYSVFNAKRLEFPNTTVVYPEYKGRYLREGNDIIHAVTTSAEQDGALAEMVQKVIPMMLRMRDAAKGGKNDPTAAPKVRFHIYTDRITRDVFIGRPGLTGVVRLKTGFPNSREAVSYLAEHMEELQEQWNGLKEIPDYRRPINAPRQGPSRREGEVTPEMFTEAFGFRGVQFGNYVEGSRRQIDLNSAYDALMDLADGLGIPARALSLDGSLGLAFGARGKGGKGAAAAHYEPGTVVINLTKHGGPGSLAHEWWHALDNYFGRLDRTGKTDPKPTRDYASESRGTAANQMRAEMWARFKAINAVVKNNAFAERSAKLDEARSKPYFSQTIEKTARGFERYIEQRLRKAGIVNDYLVNLLEAEEEATSDTSVPTGEEMESLGIRAAYDALFEVMESKETERGQMLFTGNRAAPASPIDTAAQAAAASPLNDLAEPTEAQKEAGNYAKGHVRIGGLDISIENPAGSVRRGVGADGKAWETPMVAHYGYVRGTEGPDGDHLDVFIAPGTPAEFRGTVYVVEQTTADGKAFDEHKAVFGRGINSPEAAGDLYHANYEADWKGGYAIQAMPWEQFKVWAQSSLAAMPLEGRTLATGNRRAIREVPKTQTSAGFLGSSGVSFRDAEAGIIQGLAGSPIDQGSTGGIVSGESESAATYALTGQSIPSHTTRAAVSTIVAEEARLIARAQAEGFFWDQDKTNQVLSSMRKVGGGSEHDVFLAGTEEHPLVIRSTINDSYGFAFRSPAQYLQRLEDYNRLFPELQIRLIGVSKNKRGNGVVWTVQPFIPGTVLASDEALQTAMERRGWKRIDKDYDENILYRHESTGVVMRDAHRGNVLQSGDQLYPIDVIIDDVGSMKALGTSNRRAPAASYDAAKAEGEARAKKVGAAKSAGVLKQVNAQRALFKRDARSFWADVVSGNIDRIDYYAPGFRNIWLDTEREMALARAAVNSLFETLNSRARRGFGYPAWWKSKAVRAKWQEFQNVMLPTAARLEASGVNERGEFEFKDFLMRAGRVPVEVAEQNGLSVGDEIEIDGERLRLGPAFSVRESNATTGKGKLVSYHLLLRPISAAEQSATYKAFVDDWAAFPVAKELLDEFIMPGLDKGRFIGPRQFRTAEFNRYSLRDVYNEWPDALREQFGALPELEFSDGYVPEVPIKSGISAIAGGVFAELLRSYQSPARRFAKQGLRESGDVKNLFEGFQTQLMQAHMEKVRMERRGRLLKAAAVPEAQIPVADRHLWMPVNDAFEMVYEAVVLARNLDRGAFPALTGALNPEQVDLMRSIVGEAWMLRGRAMHIPAAIYNEMLAEVATAQTENLLLKLAQWFMQQFNAASLASFQYLGMNFIGNEILKVAFAVQSGYKAMLFAMSGRMEDKVRSRLALSTARYLMQGAILDRFPLRRERFREILPREIFDTNHFYNALQGMDEGVLDNVKKLQFGSAFLAAVRAGNWDVSAKVQLANAMYQAYAREAWRDAAKRDVSLTRLSKEKKRQWLKDYVANAPATVHREVEMAAGEWLMNYENTPRWMNSGAIKPFIDPTKPGKMSQAVMAAQMKKLAIAAFIPFLRWSYLFVRKVKRTAIDEGVRNIVGATGNTREGIANLMALGTLVAAPAMLTFLKEPGGDDDVWDKVEAQLLGRSRDMEGKDLDRTLKATNRFNVSALARIAYAKLGFMEDYNGEAFTVTDNAGQKADVWLRYRNYPFIKEGIVLGLWLQALRGSNAPVVDDRIKRSSGRVAGNITATDVFGQSWQALTGEYVSLGLGFTMLKSVLAGAMSGSQSADAMNDLRNSTVDLLTSPVLPHRLMRDIGVLVDPTDRRSRPSARLGYDPGWLETFMARIPGLKSKLPLDGEVAAPTILSAKSSVPPAEQAELLKHFDIPATAVTYSKDRPSNDTFLKLRMLKGLGAGPQDVGLSMSKTTKTAPKPLVALPKPDQVRQRNRWIEALRVMSPFNTLPVSQPAYRAAVTATEKKD